MGYRIDYRPIRKIRGVEKRRSSVAALTALFLLVFVLIVNSTWSRGTEVLQKLIFSGDISVTTAALEDLAMELRAGEEVSSAVETFCRKVIQGAQCDTD